MDTPFEVPKAGAGGKIPPKYVRTFSGDMETVQQGGTPDLAPLPETPSPLERIVAPSPLSETPSAPSGEVVLPEVLGPAYTPPSATDAPLKTYGSDFEDQVRETNASSASMLAAEAD